MIGCGGVVQVGVDHRSARLDVIERLHRALAAAPPAPLRAGSEGVVRLVTCHRLELYLEGVTRDTARELYFRWFGLAAGEREAVAPFMTVRSGPEAGEHLMRVAAGLESAVLGEDQIQGQAREAYRRACESGDAGPLLHRLFHAAFRAGRRSRSETALKQGGRSLAGSAVAMLARELGDLRGRSILVLGAGEMARVAATRLRDREVGRLLLTNRTWARAQELAVSLMAEALPWAWRGRILEEVDGVVCATGAPDPVVLASWLADAVADGERRLVVVDLAVPRNVEFPRPLPGGLVTADVEGLSQRLDEDAERRNGAIAAAQAIIAEELESWISWARTRVSGEAAEASGLRGTIAG